MMREGKMSFPDGRNVSTSEKNQEPGFEELLRPDQRVVLDTEMRIQRLTLGPDGKIVYPQQEEKIEAVLKWQSKEGVIDAQPIEGTILVIFNGSVAVPNGCRDLREVSSHGALGRAGEYDPQQDVCFIDISSTWDFLNDRYQPAWVEHIARHELRHALVHRIDVKHMERTGIAERRNSDEETIDRDTHMQLAYLDELHSQFMDVVEGAISGQTSFRAFDADFYSVAATGNHAEVASITQDGKQVANRLFLLLQAFIVFKRMSEQAMGVALKQEVNAYCAAVGSVLATERSLNAAHEKAQQLFARLGDDERYRTVMSQFIAQYTPDSTESDNTPEISDELLAILRVSV